MDKKQRVQYFFKIDSFSYDKNIKEDLKKYRGFISDTFLRKKDPRGVIDKVNKYKTMAEFEKLIATLGIKYDELKNKNIFGDAVK